MKKVLLSVLAGGMFAMYSCGPSAEELAAEKKRVDDSIAAVQAEAKRIQDSTDTANAEAQRIADSTAMEAQRVADSTAAADAAKKTGKPKAKPAAKKEEPKPTDTKTSKMSGEETAPSDATQKKKAKMGSK